MKKMIIVQQILNVLNMDVVKEESADNHQSVKELTK